ncbi:MAG: tetratricopeptide repeat protein [Thermodesulfobacteriota bacterium]
MKNTGDIIIKGGSARGRLFALLLLGLIATGCAAAHAVAVKDADMLAARGEWDEAVLKYAEAYDEDPTNIHYKIKYRRARVEAGRIHFDRGEEHLGEGKHDAAILEFRAAILMDPTLGKARESLKKAERARESIYHYGRGLKALKAGEKREAKRAFKKSLSLDPDNKAVADELAGLKKKSALVIGGYELDLKSTKPITLEFRSAGVKKVFEVLSKLSGINFIFDSDMRDTKTSVFLKDATFHQALELILTTSKLARKAVSENTLVIYPDTPQKAKQYEEKLIKVFYLTNSDAKKMVNLLRTMIKARDIYVHAELNAIVVRANPDAIELAKKIIEATDLADSEVVLEVEVMEVSRNNGFNLGIDLSPDAITVAVPSSADPLTAGIITMGDLDKISTGKDLLITLPMGIINFMKEDLDVEILANPRIRVKNNEKAKIHIGERIPIITATVTTGGTTSDSVQYLDVGLKLNVEPTIRPNDEIDIKVSLEVSSLGDRTTTASGTVVYQIGTRNTETVLRLSDGETQLIGGLISDEERTTVKKIPGLGDIPVLGKLFSNTEKERVKTDILLSITPHIVRRLDVPDEENTEFLSGREDTPAPGPVIGGFEEERGGVGAMPVPPPPPLPPGTFPEAPEEEELLPPFRTPGQGQPPPPSSRFVPPGA